VVTTICRPEKVNSVSVMRETSEVALMSSISKLPKDGIMMTSAWGMMTSRYVWTRFNARAAAASNWLRGTAVKLARTTSEP
jgi:hypothetical protein